MTTKEELKAMNMIKEQPKSISQSIRQEGWKGFMRRWSDGIKKIPPEELIKSEMLGLAGVVLGTMVCMIIFIWFMKDMWPIAIILGFNLLITISQLIGKYQQYDAIMKMSVQQINIEEFMKE